MAKVSAGEQMKNKKKQKRRKAESATAEEPDEDEDEDNLGKSSPRKKERNNDKSKKDTQSFSPALTVEDGGPSATNAANKKKANADRDHIDEDHEESRTELELGENNDYFRAFAKRKSLDGVHDDNDKDEMDEDDALHDDDDQDDDEHQDDDDDNNDDPDEDKDMQDKDDGNYNFEQDDVGTDTSSFGKEKPIKKVHKLDLTATENFNEKLKRRGVLYMSRIPPRMGPSKVKQLLSVHGSVTRVYLVEEDKTAAKRRKKAGGRGGKRYVEGWIEFQDKKVAKRVALALNMTRITNYKRSVHYDDLWNLKYLHKFKWSHLTEKIAYERRVREQKLRVEMMQARKENAIYQNLVEKGQVIDQMEQRRKRRAAASEPFSQQLEAQTEAELEKYRPALPQIRQTKPVNDDDDDEGGASPQRALLGALV